MSFLDDSATLQDALAFLDAYEQEQAATAPSTTAESDLSSSMDMSSSPEPKPKRKTRAKAAKPTMRHRHRVKAELLSLRQETDTLETMLAELQTMVHVRDDRQLLVQKWTDAMHSKDSKWMEIAAREYQTRRKSETTNRRLKAALTKQLQLIKASKRFLHMKVAEEDLAVLYESQRAMAVPNQTLEEFYIAESLVARVNQLKLNADGLMREEDVMFRSQRKIDKMLGPVYETVSNMPLFSSMQHTEMIFWHGFVSNMLNGRSPRSTKSEESSMLAHVNILHVGPDDSEQQTSVTLVRDARPDRVAYLLSTFTPFRGKGMNCIEELMVIVRCASGPAPPLSAKPSSVIQIWHRVHADQRNNSHSSTGPIALDPQKENLLRSQSGHFGTFIQALESALLDESLGKDWERMPAICPFSVVSDQLDR